MVWLVDSDWRVLRWPELKHRWWLPLLVDPGSAGWVAVQLVWLVKLKIGGRNRWGRSVVMGVRLRKGARCMFVMGEGAKLFVENIVCVR